MLWLGLSGMLVQVLLGTCISLGTCARSVWGLGALLEGDPKGIGTA